MLSDSRHDLIMSLRENIASLEGSNNYPDDDQMEIDDSDKSERTADKTPDKAMSKIIRWSSYRDRSEKEVRDRLASEDFPDSSIDIAVNRAIRADIIDDARFAESFVRSKLSSGKGRTGIIRDLKQKGISPELIDNCLNDDGISQDDELQRAINYLDAHPTRSKNVREGAYRKLISKGFSADIAHRASRTWTDSQS